MGLSLLSAAQPNSRDCEKRNGASFSVAAKISVLRFSRNALAWIGAMIVALAVAVPAFAYSEMPEVSGFSNYYPWFNEVPQDRGQQSFQYFLAYHPYIAAALSHNPGLLYDAGWRSEQPALEQYLDNHPYVWQELNGPDWAEGPAETQWGYYDDEHQWRDAYWWHLNRPDWFYDNHQQWASLDSRWYAQDGAYDNQHRWHYGEWWYNQNPDWVTSNHPAWLQQHHNWENASQQQKYRQQQGIHQPGEPNNQQQAAIDRRENQTQELNQQHQGNVEQQHLANLQQEQATQQNRRDLNEQHQANLQQQAMREETQQNQRRVNQEQNLENRQQEKAHQQQDQQHAMGQQQANAHEQRSMHQENEQQHMNREPAPAAHQERQQAQPQHNEHGGDHNQH
jgi:hypothetical protein